MVTEMNMDTNIDITSLAKLQKLVISRN
jgi:hypothetical protein